jgi:hypothetical protein
MVAGKNPVFTIIYTSWLIICASLKEICRIINEEFMPQFFITEISIAIAGKNANALTMNYFFSVMQGND